MSGGRLPIRIVFGNLEGAVRKGRGVGRRKSEPIASRATSGRLTSEGPENGGVKG